MMETPLTFRDYQRQAILTNPRGARACHRSSFLFWASREKLVLCSRSTRNGYAKGTGTAPSRIKSQRRLVTSSGIWRT